MLRLQVEGSVVGIATKYHRTTFEEYEVLLDDFLNGNTVCAVGDAIGAEHAETAFVVEMSLYVA